MTKVRRLFSALLLMAWPLLSASAQPWPTVIAQHYTTDEGLPSNNVLCALKDSDGFLWFGTWYGLCRFDGARFVTYNKPVRPTSAIPPRKVESIAEDASGHLWLKTVDWKLYVFNRHTEHFHAVYDELKAYTKNLQVIKIQPTDDGHILLLTKDKTLLLATTATTANSSATPAAASSTPAAASSANITLKRLFDSRGHVDPETLQLYHDIAATAHGYSFFIGRDYRLSAHRAAAKAPRTAAAKAPRTAAWSQVSPATPALAAAAHAAGIDKYSQLYLDRDSLLWVTTTANGIYCISKPRHLFRLVALPANDLTGVRCIYQMRQGTVVVGSRSRNVYLYTPDGTLLQTLDYSRYAIGAVYYAMEDARGRLWLATKGDGLVVVPPAGQSQVSPAPFATAPAALPDFRRAVHYRHNAADATSLSGNDVYALFTDSKGHVWVGTLDGGLNMVQEHPDGTLSFCNKHNGFTHYPAYGMYSEVRNIAEDAEGRIWVGTIDGLMSFRNTFRRPEDIVFHTSHDTEGATFANNDIYTLHRDGSGDIWVGAFGGGLQKLTTAKNHGAPTFQPLGPREGLRDDVVYSITDDRQGRLWFATETGLACYDPQTRRARTINRYDGLPAVQMEETAATCLADGTIWLGTKQGMLTFQPERLQTGHADYRTFIVGLTYDNQPYAGDSALAYAKRIELDYDENAFTIEYAALNYHNHGNLNYRYRLKGFDREWRYAGSHRLASYNEVPPGRYTFIVETIDDDNPSLHSSAQLAVRILPPWWATWWAYLIYIAVAALIAWLVVRTILQMNRMRNEIYISQRLAKLTSKPDDGDEFIDRLHRIIRENIANSDFNIDAIAAEMGLSRSAFYKKVKGLTGFAPVDLIKEFRLSHAAELLQTTTLSIAEVAYRSGFKDASYFGKCFRKRYGITPSEYIKTND